MVIDDFVDDAVFTRQSKLLHSLCARGTHNSISTIVSTQKFAAIYPIISGCAPSLIVYRLRNNRELDILIRGYHHVSLKVSQNKSRWITHRNSHSTAAASV